MKNINWWKVLNFIIHFATIGLAKLQTICETKAREKDEAKNAH